jgi:hypothetical protein
MRGAGRHGGKEEKGDETRIGSERVKEGREGVRAEKRWMGRKGGWSKGRKREGMEDRPHGSTTGADPGARQGLNL